jgi:uncharacterized membrane protein YhiD involved in acid resistance
MNNSVGKSFEQFLVTESPKIPLLEFSINLIAAGLVSFLLSWIYIRYGNSLSNRKSFSKNLILISVTTMVIITIVKSSLALSLGLVGALSIVRFRAAIKEPEELAYLFMAIAIGLGFGADQASTIFTAFCIIVIFIVVRNRITENEVKSGDTNLYLTLRGSDPDRLQIDSVVELFKASDISARLKRLDEASQTIEIVFNLVIDDVNLLGKLKSDLKLIDPEIEISLIDQEGVIL